MGIANKESRILAGQEGKLAWQSPPKRSKLLVEAGCLPGVLVRLMSDEDGRIEILLADDSASVRNLVTAFLKGSGLRSLTAVSGDQAIKLAGSHTFKLVLTDYEMPGACGSDLVRALREAQPHARIVVMGGSGLTKEDRARLAENGMNEFLPKPFGPAEFHTAVLTHFHS